MYFKNIFIIISLLLSLNIYGERNEILIDKLVAVVKDTIISFSDIEKTVLLYPDLRRNKNSESYFYKLILEDMINYRTIYLEYSNEFILNESDYEKVQLQIIRKAGSIQNLNIILESFDMNWNDFRLFIREKVFFEKIIKEKFQFKISILFNDVETFYNNEYVPMQKKLNLTPKSLIDMTAEIKNHLRKIETGKKIENWIKDIKDTYDIRIVQAIGLMAFVR